MSENSPMQIYLVGGAVRDELLGFPVKERDWVVVGGSPAALEAQGFKRVGKDFPVFLHPDSGDEYALARTERKSAPGYGGFDFNTAPDVTLEQDLQRRDLSINAMARTSDGGIVDPWGGRADLEARCLRHVSPAFSEDPLRVLRVSRFAARYHHLGFSIAPQTMELMGEISASGELQYLVPERIWRETARALDERDPQVYFRVLDECGALAVLFPELQALTPAALSQLERAAREGADVAVRWAVLVAEVEPEALQGIAQRLRVPKAIAQLAQLLAERGPARAATDPRQLLDTLEAAGAWRGNNRFEQFIEACRLLDENYAARLQAAARAAGAVDIQALRKQGLDGAELGAAIGRQRLKAVEGISL